MAIPLITLDGEKESYRILISYNAQVEIEEALGKNLYQVATEPYSPKANRIIFMYGVRYGDQRKLSLEEAGQCIDDIVAQNGIKYFEDKIVEAVLNATQLKDLMEDEKPEAGKPDQSQATTK